MARKNSRQRRRRRSRRNVPMADSICLSSRLARPSWAQATRFVWRVNKNLGAESSNFSCIFLVLDRTLSLKLHALFLSKTVGYYCTKNSTLLCAPVTIVDVIFFDCRAFLLDRRDDLPQCAPCPRTQRAYRLSSTGTLLDSLAYTLLRSNNNPRITIVHPSRQLPRFLVTRIVSTPPSATCFMPLVVACHWKY